MKVTLNFGKTISNKINQSSLIFNFNSETITLPDLFNYLKENYLNVYKEVSSENSTLNPSVICIHNQQVVYNNQFHKIMVRDKDKISFSLAIGGG